MIAKNVQEKIDALFAELDRPDSPGCALGIVQDGELIYKQGYGMANLEHDIPVTPQTVFSIASVSKQFTAFSVALLEEEGKIDREEDIRTYFPELPVYPETIKVKNLIHMTSGLLDLYTIQNFIKGAPEDAVFTVEQAFANVCQIKGTFFKPGQRFSYSNTSYFLLAQLVERVSGQSLARYAAENIFKPLGMENTFFREDHTQIIKNRAQGYAKYDQSHYTDKLQAKYQHRQYSHSIALDQTECPGAGQIWTTVEDLARWVKNFSHNQLGQGGQGLIQKVTTSGKFNDGTECGYAYGQFLSERKGRPIIFHEGGGIGENAVLYMLPEEKLAIICLANSNYFLGQFYRQHGMVDITEVITDYILEGPDTPIIPRKVVNNDQPVQEEKGSEFNYLTGWYQNQATSSIWQITIEDQEVVVHSNFMGKFKLKPLGENRFQIGTDEEMTCLVDLNEQQQVRKLVFQQGDTRRGEFLPFISISAVAGELEEYLGDYRCEELNTTYTITLQDEKLYIYNKDRTNYALDLYYQPATKDHFYSHTPPYICDHLSITFFRDEAGQVQGFYFRDFDGDGREAFRFVVV